MNLKYCKRCNHSRISVEQGHRYPQYLYCMLNARGRKLFEPGFLGKAVGIVYAKKYKLSPDAEAPEGCPFVLEQLLDEK